MDKSLSKRQFDNNKSLNIFCGEGNGTPLQYSCLENPRDGGACWAAVYEVAQSRTRLKRLSSSSSNIFWAPKSLQMVAAPMKLKDACSLEEKLWPT